MVNILPNHLALVEKGRVKGAYVFDEQKEKGAKGMFRKLAAMFDSFSKELEQQADEFKESDHPRADDGKFTSGSGSHSGASKEKELLQIVKNMKSEGKSENHAINYLQGKTQNAKNILEKAGYVEKTTSLSDLKKIDEQNERRKKYKDEQYNAFSEIPKEKRDIFLKSLEKDDKYMSVLKNMETDKSDKAYIEASNMFVKKAKDFLKQKSNGAQGDADPEKEIKMTEEKKVCDAEHEDKRKLIDEIGGMLKGKVDEELWRTIIGKAEKIAYEGSEKSEADDEALEEIEEIKEGEEVKAEEVKKDEDVKAEEEIDLQKIKDEAKEEAKKEMEELIKAKEEVEDVAGKCAVQDSAAKYYKIGLEAMGISVKGVMDEDLRGMFRGAVAKNAKGTMDAAPKQDAMKETLGKLNLPKRVY